MSLDKKFLVSPERKVVLSKLNPADTGGYDARAAAEDVFEKNLRKLRDLQYLLYAENRRSLLVVLQAMDAGGKDGLIRHVMGSLNPQGCRVTSFKAPTAEELAHDYLWRIHKAVPRRGEIGVFNRSHYEDVLIARVRKLVPTDVWRRRYEQINDFERMLTDSGVHIVKFFLHVSREEQLDRLQRRLKDPTRQWKVNPEDFLERRHWRQYVEAYEEAISRCSTKHAPWYILPADHKWFRNLAAAEILVHTLQDLDMKFPRPAFDLSKIRAK